MNTGTVATTTAVATQGPVATNGTVATTGLPVIQTNGGVVPMYGAVPTNGGVAMQGQGGMVFLVRDPTTLATPYNPNGLTYMVRSPSNINPQVQQQSDQRSTQGDSENSDGNVEVKESRSCCKRWFHCDKGRFYKPCGKGPGWIPVYILCYLIFSVLIIFCCLFLPEEYENCCEHCKLPSEEREEETVRPVIIVASEMQ